MRQTLSLPALALALAAGWHGCGMAADALAATNAAGAPESLAALLARTLHLDPQVRVAQSLLQATQERNVQARSRLYPTFSVTHNSGSSSDLEFNLGVERRTIRTDAALRWNLYNGGNDMAEVGATDVETEAASLDLQRAREEAAERVANAYIDLLRSDSLLPLGQERLDAVRRLVALVQRQLEAGKAAESDAQQAQASLLDAEIAQQQLLADRDSARRKLAALVDATVRPVEPLYLPSPPDGDLVGIASGSMGAARLRADAARARVRPWQTAVAPRLDMEVRQQLTDHTKPQTTTVQQFSAVLVARWDMPLGGETLSRRNETERRAEAAASEADRVERIARAEWLSLSPLIQASTRAIEQLDRQIGHYGQLLRAGEIQFEAGRRSLAQLIALRDSRFTAQQRLAEQAQRQYNARVRQLSLAGGLLPAMGLGLAPTDAPPRP